MINYDVPDTADAYTHRVGRTGRVDRTGEALTLAQPEDEPIVRQIERVLGEPIERRRLEQFNYGDFDPLSRPKTNGNGSGPAPARRRSNGDGRRRSPAGAHRSTPSRSRSRR